MIGDELGNSSVCDGSRLNVCGACTGVEYCR